MFRFWVLLAVALTAPARADTGSILDAEQFQYQLDHAAALSTSAPWRETEAVLDQLRPYLDRGSAQQRAEFAWLEARIRALSGDMLGALEAAEALLRQDLTPELRLRSHRLAANAALLARRFEETFIHLGQGLRMLQDPALRPDGEALYSLAAYAYTLVGESERGRQFGEMAVALAETGGDERAICTTNQRLAFVHKKLGNNDNSLEHYRRALRYCETAGDGLITGVVQNGIGDLMRLAGADEEARQYFEQALNLLDAHGFDTGRAEARLYFARLELELGNHDRVRELLHPSLELLSNSEVWDYLAEAHAMLGQIARAENDYEAALEHYDHKLMARARAHDQERRRRITFLEVEFNLLHNQQQIALLEEQARVRQLEESARLQGQRIRNAAYAAAGLLIICLLLLLLHTSRERRRYRRMSQFDGLTGALNHTRFFAVAGQRLETALRQDSSFWILLGDIDFFKQVNDLHGHATGDRILRRVGRRLHDCFGAHGAIGRIGGEEFAIALNGKDRAAILDLLDRFRSQLATPRDDAPTVTMSFGLAAWRSPGDSVQAICQRADQALYQAKRDGRNQVVCQHDDTE
ncbi:MAG: diguanylate cyclase [Wenzhouxiangella sp.]|nr:diguanylate cyclase [Wenzhouxiangella sp.]TVR97178.1 MAG: diguanylate cyclase [Wenzhouxiangellaceae bacterium]